MVVDSPPGRTRASTAASSAGGAHLDRVGAEALERARVQRERALQGEHADPMGRHLEAPMAGWHGQASGGGGRRSPAPVGELGLERADLEARHGRAEAAADLGEDVGVAEVGGGLDDGLGPAWRGRRS